MEHEIVSKPAFFIAGVKYRGRNENQEIARLWQEGDSWMERIPNVRYRQVAYGVMDHFDMESGEFDYVAGFEVEGQGQVPEDLVRWEILARTFAVFDCTLPTLMEVMHDIYETWLPASGYRRADGPEFEFYGESFDPSDPQSEMQLYIPVQPV